MKRIVTVGEEPQLLQALQKGLSGDGVEVISVRNSQEALDAIDGCGEPGPDLILLDILLPGVDSFEICRRHRTPGSNLLPFLILPARRTANLQEASYDHDATDSTRQLCDSEELLARVRAGLSQLEAVSKQIQQIKISDLVLDPRARQVWRGGVSVELTRREFDVLELLARHAGQVLTKECIFERVWGFNSGAHWEVVKVYVNYVRNKLNAGGKPNLIRAVRGIGYVLRP